MRVAEARRRCNGRITTMGHQDIIRRIDRDGSIGGTRA